MGILHKEHDNYILKRAPKENLDDYFNQLIKALKDQDVVIASMEGEADEIVVLYTKDDYLLFETLYKENGVYAFNTKDISWHFPKYERMNLIDKTLFIDSLKTTIKDRNYPLTLTSYKEKTEVSLPKEPFNFKYYITHEGIYGVMLLAGLMTYLITQTFDDVLYAFSIVFTIYGLFYLLFKTKKEMDTAFNTPLTRAVIYLIIALSLFLLRFFWM